MLNYQRVINMNDDNDNAKKGDSTNQGLWPTQVGDPQE